MGIQNFTVQALKRQVESETRAKLKEQRDALLEALRMVRKSFQRDIDFLNSCTSPDGEIESVVAAMVGEYDADLAQIDAAIAKATAQTN